MPDKNNRHKSRSHPLRLRGEVLIIMLLPALSCILSLSYTSYFTITFRKTQAEITQKKINESKRQTPQAAVAAIVEVVKLLITAGKGLPALPFAVAYEYER